MWERSSYWYDLLAYRLIMIQAWRPMNKFRISKGKAGGVSHRSLRAIPHAPVCSSQG